MQDRNFGMFRGQRRTLANGLSGETRAETGKRRHWTPVFFVVVQATFQESPKAIPTCANMCHYVPAWANIAVCQLCRDRQPLWNSHDGVNLTCLDQCHGVRSHGTSSSQGWHKIIVVQSTDLQSKFDPRVYIRVFNQPALCRFACRKAFPRKVFILERKNLIEQLSLLSQHAPICTITCQHLPTLQFVSCAETDSLCGTVMMAWIWHVWINAMVFVPKVDTGHQCFFCGCTNNVPRFAGGQPKLYVWKWKNFIEQLYIANLRSYCRDEWEMRQLVRHEWRP